MTIESASFLNDLNASYPAVGDAISEGDDHFRLLKTVLKATFPGRGKVDMGTIDEAATFSFSAAETGAIYVGTGATAANLPAVSGLPNGTHWFLRTGASSILVATDDAALINGATTVTVPSNAGAIFALNGSNWIAFLFSDVTALAGPAFSAYLNNAGANQVITSGVITKVKIDTEDFDTSSSFDTSTNRFTPPAGIYQVNATAYITTTGVMSSSAVYIYKNGVLWATELVYGPGVSSVSALIQMNGTDYLELMAVGNGTGTITVQRTRLTQFSAAMIRS